MSESKPNSLMSCLRKTRMSHSFTVKCISRSVFLIFIILTSCGNTPQVRVKVETVDEKHLVYSVYRLEGPKDVDLSDLELAESLKISNHEIMRTEWEEVPDFKLLLLRNGWATLRDPAKAIQQYRDAQESAKREQIGIWAPPPTPLPSQQPEGPGLFQSAISLLVEIFTLLIWLGMGSVIVTAAYYLLYIRRRVRLLIIGKASAGKTAVFLRISDPDTDKGTILELGHTPARQFKRMKQHIKYARYDIYPRLTDVPGSAYSTVWDELTKWRYRFWFTRRHAILLVLAPTEENESDDLSSSKNKEFRDNQLGYVQALIEGAFGARKTAKPKVIIVFLNKFDLLSNFPPGDSGAKSSEATFNEFFSEHAASVRVASQKAGIRCHVIIGSALQSWNCNNLINTIGKSLYDK